MTETSEECNDSDMNSFSPEAPYRNVVRWSVSIPETLLARIRREAEARGMSHSRFASDAIEYALDHMDKDGEG